MGHDEGAGDVAVFYEAFAEGAAEDVGCLEGRCAGCVRDWYYHIYIMISMILHNLLCQLLTHHQPTLIHTHPIHNTIRPCKINILKNTR